MNRISSPSRRGSALLLALCAIAVMSIAILGLVEFTDLGMAEIAGKEKDFRAMQLAESGIAIGLFPELEKNDPVLRQELNSTESFQVRFESEGGKLNVNAVLNENQKKILEDLLDKWGLKRDERSLIVDCMMDWVDSNPLKRLHGAEQRDYEAKGLKGYPPNRPFQDLDEMDLVPGIEALNRVKPDWKDYLTVWSDGRLDLNEASTDLIAAVCEVGTMAAETFAKRRLGPDGKEDTDDDYLYTDMAQVKNALGLSDKQLADVEKRVTLKSDYRRIESTGKVCSYERKVAVVVQLNVTPAQYLTWIEF